MDALRVDDVVGRERYGATRAEIRRRLIEHKRARRISVGDRVTFLFEDRATVWYQTQEMLWVESITDLDAIRHELEVYNALLPGPAELSTTMLIEITDQSRIREELESLIGIDRAVSLDVGGHRVPGVFEAGRQTESELSAVQYVRFPLDEACRGALRRGAAVAIVIDHPRYHARTELPTAMRQSLEADLFDPEAPDAALRRVRDGR